MDALDAIFARRSIGRLAEPAPKGEHLDLILQAALAAPDHEELRPWRFFLLEGDGQDAFGQVLADAYLERIREAGGEPTQGQLTKERTKLGRAPLVVVACAVHQHESKVPWIEQQAAVAAAIENMLVAATALGYGSMWRTGDPAYDDRVKAALGLSEHDAILGFVYLGTPHEGGAKEPRRPELDDELVVRWQPA